MRYFITGASGWIGSAVTAELIGSGHQVIGLARSDAAAAALIAAGADVRRGTIDDLDTLRDAAKESDGVVHLAFKHDLAFAGGFASAAAADRLAVEAVGEALAGSDRPFVIASGTLGISPGRMATELDGHEVDAALMALGAGPQTRHGTAELVLSLASRGVRSSVVRLSPTNHGKGDNGFMRHDRRHRSREGRLRLRRRREQSLARGAPARLGASLLSGARERSGGVDAAWRRG